MIQTEIEIKTHRLTHVDVTSLRSGQYQYIVNELAPLQRGNNPNGK